MNKLPPHDSIENDDSALEHEIPNADGVNFKAAILDDAENDLFDSGNSSTDPAETNVNIKQINRIQDDLNAELDSLADRIENIVELYFASRKQNSADQPEENNELAGAA